MPIFRRLHVAALIIFFLINACAPKKDAAVEMVTVGGEQVPVIHVDKISDNGTVKLSDWVSDLRFIPLETTDPCIFDYPMRTYVGKEYILISTIKKGILMFDQNGKFISNLASHGKGPGELMDANRNIFVDEKNDRLYVADFGTMKGRMMVYDIKTGKFNEIPIMHKGPEIGIRDIIVRDDSLMYITTMQYRGGKSDCPLFCQTTSGRLLWELKKTHPLGLTDASIELVDGEIYMYYNFLQDTTWVVDGQQIKPVAVIASDAARAYPKETVGSVYIGLNPITGKVFLGSMTSIKSLDFDERYGGNRAVYDDRQNFTYDFKAQHARNIGEIQNDFLGNNDKFYLRFQPNGVAVMTYQAFDLREIADSVSKQPDVQKDIKSRMKFILEKVGETDNPVLVVGQRKKI